MKNLFVPYEIALVLKEIGFDEPCLAYWLDGNIKITSLLMKNHKNFPNETSAPTYDQVIDWFIEKHNLHIDITTYYNPHKLDKILYEVAISQKDNGYEGLMQNASNRISENWIQNPAQYNLYDTRKEALNAGILKAIELIK